MGLTESQLEDLREKISSSARPLVLFDDDPDGLCSFLMVYKHIKEGRGMPVKNTKSIGPETAYKINEYAPDLLIILDIPMISSDFLDLVHTPIIWVDHHPLQEARGITYYNPRAHDASDNSPTSYWIYRALRENLWIAMIGMIGDWFIPEKEIKDKFMFDYPELLSEEIQNPGAALHDSKLGELAMILSFNLKGRSTEVMKSVKVLTRIKDPYEILHQMNAGGRFIYKKYLALKDKYDQLMRSVVVDPNNKLIFFQYANEGGSFSAELSNELIYRHPDKVILVAWEYNGEYKCSLRSTKVNLPALLQKALVGLSGYGGGHDLAVGACVKTEHFKQFVENIRKEL